MTVSVEVELAAVAMTGAWLDGGTLPIRAMLSTYHPTLEVEEFVARRQRIFSVFPAYFAESVRLTTVETKPPLLPDQAASPLKSLELLLMVEP